MEPRPHHNRRQRKKLHLGEFQELGFAISAGCPADWTLAQRDFAMITLLETLDAHGLCFGGGDSAGGMDGYVACVQRRSASDAEREMVRAKLAELGFTDPQVAPLSDAWYPDEASA